MRIIFLGTNGWFDTDAGNTVCILIETRTEYIILDAGNGIYKIDRYIKTKKPIYLFISHYHLDHIEGLHILNKFNFPQGMDVFGPPGLKPMFDSLINVPYTMPVNQLKTKIRLFDLNKKIKPPISFKFGRLSHSSLCYGYRFYLESKIITYCTDTGLCENLFLLAKEADLFITECAFKSGQYDKRWPHLNPEAAARVAKEAKANKLMLVHFDADLYKTLKERKTAETQARRIFKNTLAGVDDMRIEV